MAHQKKYRLMNKVPFPLVGSIGPLLSLDDEAIFHRLLKRILGTACPLKCFNNTREFTQEVSRQLQLQEQACAELSQVIEAWRDDGASLREGIISYWRSEPEIMASTFLVDFRMPNATGLEILARPELQAWRGGKLLLTAHADDHIAVVAFNEGLIDQFVSKQMMAEDPDRFIATIHSICSKGNSLVDRVWGTQVSLHQQSVLQACQATIQAAIRERGWIRHAVLGEPWGILRLTHSGAVQWLQLETDASMLALLEMLDATPTSASTREAIADRKSLISMEVRPGKSQLAQAPAFELGTSEHRLLGAFFEIEEAAN